MPVREREGGVVAQLMVSVDFLQKASQGFEAVRGSAGVSRSSRHSGAPEARGALLAAYGADETCRLGT